MDLLADRKDSIDFRNVKMPVEEL
uniref:Uncharacterized protein n=1 Tax=Arundo donax TaxID=35708 RepID=A0A0A8ZQT5_ARUDO